VSGERLWVTGLGLVTPLAVGVEATWAALVRGDRAIRRVTLFDVTGQRVGLAAEVGTVTAAGPGWSRSSAMAAMAAEEAMVGAGVDLHRSRVGLVVGGTTGGMFETEELLARLHAVPECREALVDMLSHPLTATSERLDERLGPFARVRTLSSACSSGANALVVAASWLRAGGLDAVVAGASDGLCRLTLSGFNALGLVDPEPCRPFDRRRRGVSLGEGAGFVVIEREASARKRGVRAIAELAGWAMGAEAYHITNPAPDVAVVGQLVARAVERAVICAGDVDYVNAHGTGTPLNDPMEAAALAFALGPEIARIPISSSKGQIGHTLGAAGAIEAAITALVVSRRVLVPTGGLDEPDPGLALVHVPRVGREVARVRAAVSNAFGFGGMDTVLVFTEPRESPSADREAGSFCTRTKRDHGSPRKSTVITGAAIFGPWGLASGADCASLLDLRQRAEPNNHDASPDALLDPIRARRLDRSARLGAVTVCRALADAGVGHAEAGIVLGSAFGNVDGSAAFMHRIFERGPRSASPAEFPNLVPSSPVGHTSIYLGLRGPSFATADLATSGESAFVQAVQLVAAGEAACVVGGAVEPKSDIVERVLAALFAHRGSQAGAARDDIAAALVVEDEAAVRARGGRAMARVRQVVEWRGPRGEAVTSHQAGSSAAHPRRTDDAKVALAQLLPPPRDAPAEVVLVRAIEGADELLSGSAWSAAARFVCAPAVGESDALGAVALAVGAARVAQGRAGGVLVLGLARARGYAAVLSPA
jgi:3-oxoacyl-[acyl-carrier-protein] synthase II